LRPGDTVLIEVDRDKGVMVFKRRQGAGAGASDAVGAVRSVAAVSSGAGGVSVEERAPLARL